MKSTSARESFWNEKYESNQTGWDMHQVSPPLSTYIDSIGDRNTKILIPGCGNAYEAEYLLQKGFHQVTLIDISSVLTASLREKFSGQPIKIIYGDFFNHKGQYDLILEQTFFCAISPGSRKDYVKHAFDLLHDNGKIAGVLFNNNFGFEDHPPYKGSKDEYTKLFTPYFNILQLRPCENSIPPRMGNELFIEFQKREKPLI